MPQCAATFWVLYMYSILFLVTCSLSFVDFLFNFFKIYSLLKLSILIVVVDLILLTMDSDISFQDVEGDYLRLCEERRSNLVSRDTEDHLPVVSQPIPPRLVPAVVPPLVSVANSTSERTDTIFASSMSYPSIQEEPGYTSTETQMETQAPASAVVVVTIKTDTSVSGTTIPPHLLTLPPHPAEFSHNKPSVNLPLVSHNVFYVQVNEDPDIPLCLIPSCNHSYTEGYPLMPVRSQGKFLYKQLKLPCYVPPSNNLIFQSITDTLFFLIVKTDMNIEDVMKHFFSTDFRGNVVPLLRSIAFIRGERLILKTFLLWTLIVNT